MTLTINEKNTPILFQQPESVQKKAVAFHENYHGKKSVAARVAWGEMLIQIRDDVKRATFGEGDNAKELDEKETFSNICRELGIPRQTAYDYIDLSIAVNTYPQAIQEAAAKAGLNLALPHVMDYYKTMDIPKDPKDLTPLVIRGIIAELEEAKAPKEEQKPLTQEDFDEKLAMLIKRAKKSKLTFEVTLETLIAASYEAGKVYTGESKFTVEDSIQELQLSWETLMLDRVRMLDTVRVSTANQPVPIPALAKATTASATATDGLGLETSVPADVKAAKAASE